MLVSWRHKVCKRSTQRTRPALTRRVRRGEKAKNETQKVNSGDFFFLRKEVNADDIEA